MRVDRRHFIAAGLGGVAAACHPFILDPTVPWLSVQIPGLIGLTKDDRSGGLIALMVDPKAVDPMLRQHFPRLVTDQSNVDMRSGATTAKPAGTKVNPKTGMKSLLYWDLTAYKVTFPAEPGNKIVRAKTLGKRLEHQRLPDLLTIGDASWIPQMAKLTPTGKSRVNPACLGQNPQSAKVAARVDFGSGALTSIFPRSKTGRYDKIEFRFEPEPPRGPYQQALGVPRLIQQLSSGTVTIKLEPFDGTMATQIVLNRTEEFGDPIEMEVKNESADPDDPGFVDCMNDDDLQVLHHFGALYALLDPSDQGSLKPIPHAVAAAEGFSLPHCPATDVVIWCPGGSF